jgi:hypothetical protein
MIESHRKIDFAGRSLSVSSLDNLQRYESISNYAG